MRLNRMLLSTCLVVVALVVQACILARLQLPGAVPDLLLLVVVGLALVYGHTTGALVGFGAGLLADLVPPADHAVGRYALVLCLIGYAAGLVKPEGGHQHRSATVPMIAIACAAVGSTLLYAAVGGLVGDTAVSHAGLGWLVFTATLYDLLLAPFAVPAIMALARRTERDPIAEGSGGTAAGGVRSHGWLTSGTGLSLSGNGGGNLFGKSSRGPGGAGIGSQRGSRPGRMPRRQDGRNKGVKKL